MALNLGEASKKLNKSEYVLYLSTEAEHISRLSPKQIEARIERMEKLLLKLKSDRISGSKIRRVIGLAGNKDNVNRVKTRYFTEGLKRLKREQKKRNTREEARKNKMIAESRRESIYRRMNRGKKSGPKINVKQALQEQNIKVNAKQRSFENSETKRKVGHASARNKRVQGKRDSR